MRRHLLTLVWYTGITAGGALAPVTAAQTARTVWDGVYSEEQATRGETLYADRCARCHGDGLGGVESAPALTGSAFYSNWEGETLEALFERMRSSMPADKPGSLSRAQNADVLAHMLQVGGYPAGRDAARRAGRRAHHDHHPDVQAVTRGHGLNSERTPAMTRTRRTTTLILASTAAPGAGTTPGVQGQSGARTKGEWPTYGGDLGHTRYAPLDQITAANFGSLEVEWRFKTDNLGPAAGVQSRVDAADGRRPALLHRRHAASRSSRSTPPPASCSGCTARTKARAAQAAPRQLSGRGLAYWTDGKEERILYVTPGYRLVALDAKTGNPVAGFGRGGIVDLKQDLDNQKLDLVNAPVGLHATPIVAGNVVMVGAAFETGANPRSRAQRARAPCAATTCAPASGCGRSAPSRSPASSATRRGRTTRGPTRGNTGVWAQISVDEELGMAYLPVELPTHDYYGGARPGQHAVRREPRRRRSARPASASGTSSSCTTASGTWTSRARRSSPTSPSTAGRSRPWRSRPSRRSSTCSIA